MCQCIVPVAMGVFRVGDTFVDVDVFVFGSGAHELDDLTQCFARLPPGQQGVCDDDGTCVDEGIARATGFGLQLNDGVEGAA